MSITVSNKTDIKHIYILDNPWPCIEQLDTVTKSTNARNCIKLSYIINIVFLLHVSVTLVAILTEAHYKRGICGVSPKALGLLNTDNGIDMLSRNVGKKLPLLTV